MIIRLTYMTFNHVKSSTCPSAACLASVAAFSPQGTRFAFLLGPDLPFLSSFPIYPLPSNFIQVTGTVINLALSVLF